MNLYTKRERITESADLILAHSDLLIKADCIVIDNIVYERCTENINEYRFYFSADSYDYVDDVDMIAALDTIFKRLK